MAAKQHFQFTDVGSPMNESQRVAHALEFIAHYLDRIDGHLEVLAAQAKNDPAQAQIARSLTDIGQFLGRIASKA